MRLLREDLHMLTGAYALDAIDGAERDRFERHLHRCQPCGHEVRGLQETATRLAVAVAGTPPPAMKAAVLASAARTRQLPPAVDARPAPDKRAARGRRPRLAVVIASVATAVVIALGIAFGMQRDQLDTVRAQQRAVAAVLNAPDARIVTEPTSLGGTATMVVSAHQHRLIFTTNGLPALASSRVYQLWVVDPGGGATSVGLLTRSGTEGTLPVLASGLIRGDRMGVTVEPSGGTKQPTTKPIVVISAGG